MFDHVVADIQANWFLYLSIPITGSIVGYATNVLALKMMFLPLDFTGWRPLLGWQGIVPRKAGKMASITVDTLVPRLVTERQIYDRLDPQRVAQEIEAPMLELISHMTEDILAEFEPRIWETLPRAVQQRIIRRIQEDAPKAVAELMAELRNDIENVFDLKDMVITTLVRDKRLMNRIFQETGREEFRFIAKSGLYFGAVFGVLQMLGWLFYQAPWQLPIFGLLVGYLTNAIALRLIFQPQTPLEIGPWRVQGLFHKRQKEVSRDYGQLIADEVVTPGNIIEAVLKGPCSDRVFMMIARHVKQVIDAQSGIARPLVVWTLGSRRYTQMKDAAVARLVAKLPETIHSVDSYAKEAMDLANTLSSQLAALPPAEFEAMLRPAFQEDEWMLIAAGAVLGTSVGIGQLILFGIFAG